jgi:hypothetical protein
MSNNNIDELIKGLSESKKSNTETEHFPDTHKEEKKEVTTVDTKKKVIIISLVSFLFLIIFITAYSYITSQQQLKNQSAERVKESSQSVSRSIEQSEAEAKEKKFVLTKDEYKENIDLLSSADIGLKKDEKKGLVGTLTFEGGKTEEVLSYNRKDGSLHCLDSEENAVTHNNKWVRALIEKIKAKEKNSQKNSPSNSING